MRYCFRFLALILVIVALLPSCKRNVAPHIVAEIDGDAITAAEFTAEFFPLVESYDTPLSDQEQEALKNLKEALLDQLIEKRIILHEAPTSNEILGGLVILTGIFIVAKNRKNLE